MAPLSASQLPPEELRAGEKIAYYSMAFPCGNPQGYREAIVLKVDTSPGADKQLDLDSSDIIAPTQMLKRLVDQGGGLQRAGRCGESCGPSRWSRGSTTLRRKPARSAVPSRRQSGGHTLL
jgi:hypothetical protein